MQSARSPVSAEPQPPYAVPQRPRARRGLSRLARARHRAEQMPEVPRPAPVPQLPADPSRAQLLHLPGLPKRLDIPETEDERAHLEETLEIALLLHRCEIVPERVAPTADGRGYVRLSFNDLYRLILNAEEE